MKVIKSPLSLALIALSLFLLPAPIRSQSSAPPKRQVAVTIDDLPAGASNFMTATEITDMTTRLLATLQQEKIPVVGFVNERKLYTFGEVDQRIKALEMWLDAGYELGNHTYSHASLNRVGLKQWEEEVIEGEPVLRLLMVPRKMTLRYFRHPYLDTGLDLQTRRESEAFLASRGYRIAPVTLDAWDWMFAFVYDDAKKRNDTVLQDQLAAAYLSYSDAVFDYCEKLSLQIMGYEPKQVLLLHANRLEADHISDLAAVMRKRGYSFIPLDQAISDAAYSLPDTYVGEGTGWLDHWAITQGKPPHGAVDFPAWVLDRAKSLRQPQ
jgi:peptidoglycan-N-acetylglucosamine deacetylase